MFLHSLEPFIILPYKEKQDILFYSESSIKQYSDFLKDVVYCELANKIVKENLIKVVVNFSYIIVFHIYPTKFEEKCSGRKGQNLIIGYIINKKELIVNFDDLIWGIECFFDSVKICAKNNNVPTHFLLKVNNGDDAHIIETLDKCRQKINRILYRKYYCPNLKYKRNIYNLLLNDIIKKNISIQYDSRLKPVYNYIRKNCLINKEFWVLVDCKEASYYNLKNKHLINLLEKF